MRYSCHCDVRAPCKKGHWQTVQTQIKRSRTRRLISFCTICLNYRKWRVKLNSLQSPFSTICPAYTNRPTSAVSALIYTIGIKHGFSRINIRQVPWEMLKTEAEGVFNTSQGTWRMLMHWKNMFDRYHCIKTENVCYISRYFLHYFVSPFHRCLTNLISTDMPVLGPGSIHLVTAANLWPRYDHIESCVAVH